MSDDEWALVAPYLPLLPLEAGQRRSDLREVFNAVRYLVRSGAPWRYLPVDFPPWAAVYQQTQRWLARGCFAAIAHDLRARLRVAAGRDSVPTAVGVDARTLRTSRESGPRVGFDGHKRTRGSKVHAAVDALGHLLALTVTPADTDERTPVAALARAVQEATGQTVELASVDQGYTGAAPAAAAAALGIRLEVVKHPEARRGFILLPRRWVVEIV